MTLLVPLNENCLRAYHSSDNTTSLPWKVGSFQVTGFQPLTQEESLARPTPHRPNLLPSPPSQLVVSQAPTAHPSSTVFPCFLPGHWPGEFPRQSTSHGSLLSSQTHPTRVTPNLTAQKLRAFKNAGRKRFKRPGRLERLHLRRRGGDQLCATEISLLGSWHYSFSQ